MIPKLKKPSKGSRKTVLTVNKEKCKFHLSAILFMGNQLSTWDIGPIQSKAEAVKEALKPETVAEVSAGSRPWDKGGEGGGRSAIKFFRLFGPQFGLKIRRGGGVGGARAPPLDPPMEVWGFLGLVNVCARFKPVLAIVSEQRRTISVGQGKRQSIQLLNEKVSK